MGGCVSTEWALEPRGRPCSPYSQAQPEEMAVNEGHGYDTVKHKLGDSPPRSQVAAPE